MYWIIGYFVIAFVWYRFVRAKAIHEIERGWALIIITMLFGITWIISIPIILIIGIISLFKNTKPPTWL